MSKTIVINSSNFVVGSGNKFTYSLPTTVKFDSGSSIAVSNISIYNSIQNITAQRNNNKITLNWLGTDYVFTIPDGYYSVSDLNFFLQAQCIQNGLYLIASNGTDNLYYVELVINSVRYSVSMNFYTIPTDAQITASNFTKPPNATWTNGTPSTPTLSFGQIFGNLLGFTFGTYPAVKTSNIQLLSNQTPVISPSDSIIFCCNLINSRYSIPNNILHSLPLTGSIGTMIIQSLNPVYINVSPQIYSEITITLYDQLFQPLVLIDKEMTLTLSIMDG